MGSTDKYDKNKFWYLVLNENRSKKHGTVKENTSLFCCRMIWVYPPPPLPHLLYREKYEEEREEWNHCRCVVCGGGGGGGGAKLDDSKKVRNLQ